MWPRNTCRVQECGEQHSGRDSGALRDLHGELSTQTETKGARYVLIGLSTWFNTGFVFDLPIGGSQDVSGQVRVLQVELS
jgi:hypothetical protein